MSITGIKWKCDGGRMRKKTYTGRKKIKIKPTWKEKAIRKERERENKKERRKEKEKEKEIERQEEEVFSLPILTLHRSRTFNKEVIFLLPLFPRQVSCNKLAAICFSAVEKDPFHKSFKEAFAEIGKVKKILNKCYWFANFTCFKDLRKLLIIH